MSMARARTPHRGVAEAFAHACSDAIDRISDFSRLFKIARQAQGDRDVAALRHALRLDDVARVGELRRPRRHG